MQTPLDEIPGNSTTIKLENLRKTLVRLESFLKVHMTLHENTRMAVAIFGSEKEAQKAIKITINNKQISMAPAPIYDPLTQKGFTIRAWDILLNTNKPELEF